MVFLSPKYQTESQFSLGMRGELRKVAKAFPLTACACVMFLYSRRSQALLPICLVCSRKVSFKSSWSTSGTARRRPTTKRDLGLAYTRNNPTKQPCNVTSKFVAQTWTDKIRSSAAFFPARPMALTTNAYHTPRKQPTLAP